MIEFKKVRKVYPNGTVGLDDINLTIQPGEFVIIVGLSGAGKSTLLRAINRLHEITSGEIVIDGKSITAAKGKDLRRIRRDIGMIFQNFNLVKRVSVLKNVLSGRVGYHSTLRTMLGLWPKRDVEIALDALSRVNIREKAYARADELSGGQQQRVSIARALVNNPAVIIADEPTGNLDPDTSWEIVKLFEEINNRGTTIVMATHDREIVNTLKKRVIAVEGGQIVRDQKRGLYGYEA